MSGFLTREAWRDYVDDDVAEYMDLIFAEADRRPAELKLAQAIVELAADLESRQWDSYGDDL